MGKGRVLIVDDDEDLVKSLSGLLYDEGFTVSSTADGSEALAFIRTVAPAVVLLDVWLPGMDGVETLQALRAMHVDVEVIAISGHGNIATAVQMIKLGAFDYLEKPLSSYRVLSVIERAFAHRERRHNTGAQDAVPSYTAVAFAHSTPLNTTHGQEATAASRASTQRWRQDTAAQQSLRHSRQRTLDRSVVLYGQGL